MSRTAQRRDGGFGKRTEKNGRVIGPDDDDDDDDGDGRVSLKHRL